MSPSDIPRGSAFFLQQIVKEADILFLEREFPGLLLFYDLDDAVVDGRGNTALTAPFAHDAVDRVDLAGLALFEILQHGRLDGAVLFHCDGHKKLRNGALEAVFIIEQFRKVLALHGRKRRARSVADVDALLHAAHRRTRRPQRCRDRRTSR